MTWVIWYAWNHAPTTDMHGLIVALVAASAAAQTCPASLVTFEKCQSRAKNIGMGLRNDSTWPRWYFPEGVMVVALRKHGVGVETIYRRHDHMIDRTGCEP